MLKILQLEVNVPYALLEEENGIVSQNERMAKWKKFERITIEDKEDGLRWGKKSNDIKVIWNHQWAHHLFLFYCVANFSLLEGCLSHRVILIGCPINHCVCKHDINIILHNVNIDLFLNSK